MNEFRKFSKIKQFRQVCKAVSETARYHNRQPPIISFTGTVKLHGTNSCVSFDYNTMRLGTQKRTQNITIDDDNYGFAAWVEHNKEEWFEFFRNIHQGEDQIYVYGEWVGKDIMKGVGVNGLEKSFFAYRVTLYADGTETWSDEALCAIKGLHSIENFYSIKDFKTYSIDIDFNNPQLSQNKLIELTLEVEEECPVSKALGVTDNLRGEGIVWMTSGGEYTFKTKGEKHSVSKVKTLVPVDIEKLNSINDFVNYAVTENRLEQGLENISSFDIEHVGNFLSWVFADIISEETDVIEEHGLTRKDYSRAIATKARMWYMKKLDEDAGL